MFPSGLPYNFPGVKDPDAFLDYSWDASDFLDPVNDDLASVSVSTSPWGTGELVASNLTVQGNVITFWLASGVPGRRYTIKIEAGTDAGRNFEWPIGLHADPALTPYPFPRPAANSGFSAVITWNYSWSLNFSQTDNSAMLVLF
jgi:hypothetical protein